MPNETAEAVRLHGNDAYGAKKYNTACKCYTEALREYEDDEEGVAGKVKSYTNRALVYSLQKNWEACVQDCNYALILDPACFKARHRRANGFHNLKNWAGLLEDTSVLLRDSEAGKANFSQLELKKLTVMASLATKMVPKDAGGGGGNDDATAATSPPSATHASPPPNVHKLNFSSPQGGGGSAGGEGSTATPGGDPPPASHPALAGDQSGGGPSVAGSPLSSPASSATKNSDGGGGSGGGGGDDAGSGGGEAQRGAVKGLCGACCRDATSTCKRCGLTVYCSRTCQATHWKYHKEFCTRSLDDPSPKFSPKAVRRGRVGLDNFGNSCYLNSALACLSHCWPIARHLVTGSFESEVNEGNDLGSQGQVARHLAALFQALWFGHNKCASAIQLKRAIDKRTEDFAGFVQHDAAEFFGWLVDMLHEDLNRVLKRTYVEIPDPGDRPDCLVRDELWLCHKKRNDSVVVDTLTGVLKSTITCPSCCTPWRKFDVFNTLELPLPLRDTRSLKVVVVKRDPHPPQSQSLSRSSSKAGEAQAVVCHQTAYAVEIHRRSTLREVGEAVAKLSGVPVHRLFFWELYEGKAYQLLHDKPKFLVSKLASTDVLVASELPDWLAFAKRDDTGLLPPPSPTKINTLSKQFAAKATLKDSDDEAESEDGGDNGAGAGDKEGEEGGTVTVLLMHRNGEAKTKTVRTFRGTQVQDASEYFGQPLVVAARTGWTVGQLKQHAVSQIAHLLGPFGDNLGDEPSDLEEGEGGGGTAARQKEKAKRKRLRCLGIVAESLLVAQVGSLKGEPKSGRWKLADQCYDRPGTSELTLEQAFEQELGPNSSPQPPGTMVVGAALEWSQNLLPFAARLDPDFFKGNAAAEAAACEDGGSDDAFDGNFEGNFDGSFDGNGEGAKAGTKGCFSSLFAPQRTLVDGTVAQLAHLDEPLSLHSCLGGYCADEKMESGEEYYCGKCKAHQASCTKSLSLASVPEVLVLTLKRFGRQLRADAKFLPDKLQDLVDFPLDGLDVSPFTMQAVQPTPAPTSTTNPTPSTANHNAAAATPSSPRTLGKAGQEGVSTGGGEGGADAGGTLYDCFGVVNHYGHVNFGHYKAFVRGGEWHETKDQGTGGEKGPTSSGGGGGVLPDQWFEFDDDLIRKIPTEAVVSQGAYVLFYRRRASGVGSSASKL